MPTLKTTKDKTNEFKFDLMDSVDEKKESVEIQK